MRWWCWRWSRQQHRPDHHGWCHQVPLPRVQKPFWLLLGPGHPRRSLPWGDVGVFTEGGTVVLDIPGLENNSLPHLSELRHQIIVMIKHCDADDDHYYSGNVNLWATQDPQASCRQRSKEQTCSCRFSDGTINDHFFWNFCIMNMMTCLSSPGMLLRLLLSLMAGEDSDDNRRLAFRYLASGSERWSTPIPSMSFR